MLIVAFLTLVLAQGDGRTLTTVSPEEAQPAPDAFQAEPEPEVITRGRTTTIVVRGGDIEALKTLAVSPADGVRLGEIRVLPPEKDGRKAVSVAVTVDASAKSGDRDLTLVQKPTIMGSGARPGDDEAAKQLEKMMQEIIKRETKAQPAGMLHINSHDIRVTKVEIIAGKTSGAARITIEDAEGDIAADALDAGKEAGGAGFVQIVEPISSEARCGNEIFYAVLMDTQISERKPPSVVLQADLDTQELAGKSGCELRVRVEDKAGNLSAWSTTKLDR